MILHKKVTKSGGVTIPRVLRHEVGITAGTPVEVTADADGIHISKHVPTCFHCGSIDDVVSTMEMEICKNCYNKMGEEFENDNRNEREEIR